MNRSIRAALVALSNCFFTAHLAHGAQFTAPIATHPPIIDGVIGAAEWQDALSADGFAMDGKLDRRRVQGYVMADEAHIYVAIRSQLPAAGSLVAKVEADVEKLAFDDSVEIWIDPTPGSEDGAVYQFIANSAGHSFYIKRPRGREEADLAWRGGWTTASSLHDGYWDFEASIPVSSVKASHAVTSGAWGINLCRDWKQPWAFGSLQGGNYAPDASFHFIKGAPAVRQTFRTDPFTGNIDSTFSVANATSEEPVHVTQHLTSDRMPDVFQDDTKTVGPGETKTFQLQADDGISTHCVLRQQAVEGGGSTVLFNRTVKFDRLPGDWRWTTAVVTKPLIDLQFAYYPYLDKLRLAVDTSGLAPEAKLRSVVVSIRPKDKADATIKSISFDRFDANKRQSAEVLVPDLDGDYEIVAKALGTNVPSGEIVKPFSRHRFPWEHNPAGVDKMYAPFEPLKISGNNVRAVLRDHTLNGLGLLDQVVAKSAETGVSKPILAAPMHWLVETDNGNEVVKPAVLHVDQHDDVRVSVSGGFQAGPLAATTQTSFALDGMALVHLTLEPTNGRVLKNLTLDIPFKDDAAQYFHAMDDGIRDVILTEAVPGGQGTVWESSKLRGTDMQNGFCSYIYVGSPVRGLAFFAENDKGWSWNPHTPNVELIRQGATLTLRVHLVNVPLTIDRPREIVFGFQAAPIKPRLSPWRYQYVRDNYALLGTDINWFAQGSCGSVYPAGRDMSFWDALKRADRARLSEAEVTATYERGKPYFAPYGADLLEGWKRTVNYQLHQPPGRKMIFYYNRASCQLFDEFQTFGDEWGLQDYNTVGPGNSRDEIPIVPSQSYIDQALYWYGKAFDIAGSLGVYWDNWYLHASDNTMTTAAYKKPDGTIEPATGILGLRSLARRTFNYMNERKMVPITMAHMTSTSILPMLGFATVQYDWEWHYSQGDVQNRFPRPYLLLVSDGELAGTWPVLLMDHGKLSDDPWTQRTFAAVSIVHELQPDRLRADWLGLYKPIFSLLDNPRLIVYRYWDERPQPVVSGDSDLPTIVYSVPGQSAVAAVTSYVDHDTTTTLTIDPKALGFGGAYTVTDVETGEILTAAANRVTFALKKHDIRELRIVPVN